MPTRLQHLLPRPASTEARWGWRVAPLFALVLIFIAFVPRLAQARPAAVIVEIDPVAERLVDPRSARRLVPLELSDVAVPPVAGTRGAPVLFFRVLGRVDGSLRIELWERGEYHGARSLSGSGENPQLVARRVALAAAELGRRLARKREAMLAREERFRRAREAYARELSQRTQDGPVALRSELAFAMVPSRLKLAGLRVVGELSLRGPLRLDVGGELWAGALHPGLGFEMQGVNVGPAYRWELTRRFELDVGVQAAALLLQVPAARSLDGLPAQDSSWTARVGLAARLEVRLTRQVRAFCGAEAGALLRSVPYQASSNADERLRGMGWGGALGVVVTPP